MSGPMHRMPSWADLAEAQDGAFALPSLCAPKPAANAALVDDAARMGFEDAAVCAPSAVRLCFGRVLGVFLPLCMCVWECVCVSYVCVEDSV